ncbi:MAG: hypothetical protein Ta2E_08770 [Mycoplasmoidaceae bacterium]|nr:MAG: hypothetical protein Ta2E_08770 [Mycoplasmoidaceae bacterium]
MIFNKFKEVKLEVETAVIARDIVWDDLGRNWIKAMDTEVFNSYMEFHPLSSTIQHSKGDLGKGSL